MKIPRRSFRGLGVVCAAYLLLLVDWRGSAVPRAPVVLRAFRVSAPLHAGAATVRLAPPLPVVRAGYGPQRARAEVERDPLEVRAVVLRAGDKTLALVLIDLVLIPDDLTRALEARLADLALDGLLLVATHTHSSVGGFDRRILAQFAGTGRYREDVVAVLLGRSEEAVRQAAHRLVPVRVRTGERALTGWAENRSAPGAPVDDALTVAELSADGGQRVATLAVVAAHPTLHPRTARELSADYPGVAMRRIAAGGAPALVFQGAHADAKPPGSGIAAIEAAGAFVAQQVSEAAAQAMVAPDRLAFAEVELGLPRSELQRYRSFFVRRPVSNLLEGLAQSTTRVAAVTIGDVTLVGVPGEVTEEAAERIMASLPRAPSDGRRLRVVSLAQGYVGYIDTPERVRAGVGEARRAFFAPELLETITRGVQAVVAAQERAVQGPEVDTWTAIQYLNDPRQHPIAVYLAERDGKATAGLFTLGALSHLAMMAITPSSEVAKDLAARLETAALEAQLPRTSWGGLVDALRNGSSSNAVREEMVKMIQAVAAATRQ